MRLIEETDPTTIRQVIELVALDWPEKPLPGWIDAPTMLAGQWVAAHGDFWHIWDGEDLAGYVAVLHRPPIADLHFGLLRRGPVNGRVIRYAWPVLELTYAARCVHLGLHTWAAWTSEERFDVQRVLRALRFARECEHVWYRPIGGWADGSSGVD